MAISFHAYTSRPPRSCGPRPVVLPPGIHRLSSAPLILAVIFLGACHQGGETVGSGQTDDISAACLDPRRCRYAGQPASRFGTTLAWFPPHRTDDRTSTRTVRCPADRRNRRHRRVEGCRQRRYDPRCRGVLRGTADGLVGSSGVANSHFHRRHSPDSSIATLRQPKTWCLRSPTSATGAASRYRLGISPSSTAASTPIPPTSTLTVPPVPFLPLGSPGHPELRIGVLRNTHFAYPRLRNRRAIARRVSRWGRAAGRWG